MTSPSRSLLHNRDFVMLWTAESVSVSGTQITLLALPIIAATTLNASALQFGLQATVEMLPFILLSLPAGVWVDRLRRRRIMIVGDLNTYSHVIPALGRAAADQMDVVLGRRSADIAAG